MQPITDSATSDQPYGPTKPDLDSLPTEVSTATASRSVHDIVPEAAERLSSPILEEATPPEPLAGLGDTQILIAHPEKDVEPLQMRQAEHMDIAEEGALVVSPVTVSGGAKEQDVTPAFPISGEISPTSMDHVDSMQATARDNPPEIPTTPAHLDNNDEADIEITIAADVDETPTVKGGGQVHEELSITVDPPLQDPACPPQENVVEPDNMDVDEESTADQPSVSQLDVSASLMAFSAS
jgi:hypothetical protein